MAGKKPVQYPCGQCGGTGQKVYRKERGVEMCTYCAGTGKVTVWE